MLLVWAKFAKIVKVCETIEDGLKSGNIARVAASPWSSGLLIKKREEVAAISHGGRKTPRSSSYSQALDLLTNPTKLATHKLVIPNILQFIRISPPLIQTSKLHYTKVHPQLQKSISHFPKSSSTLPNSISYQGVAPNYANVQSSYRATHPIYQVQAPLYQNIPLNYQAPSPNYQTNPYPRSQAPRLNIRSYQ